MPSIEPPEDKAITTLFVGGRIDRQIIQAFRTGSWTDRQIDRMQLSQNMPSIEPPKDKAITTLFVGGRIDRQIIQAYRQMDRQIDRMQIS